jgi:hypothetical protein
MTARDPAQRCQPILATPPEPKRCEWCGALEPTTCEVCESVIGTLRAALSHAGPVARDGER